MKSHSFASAQHSLINGTFDGCLDYLLASLSFYVQAFTLISP